ncbi:DUF309 domain-containing protein [Cytobacillus sp. NCCP-133]|uniref:DUF309 domain-containing protein n=1 Tax=Cytobacillus sp. NCCP-133 TaxID=766848 RepID=UPI00222F8580|nr:DUF309 domain-containing protein [Cytobacillus sp. NCCP-133]GLB58052.1 hypothetical protein NCCP133_01850 [Cytobacillus sp. NCCP-133]
MYPDEYIQFLIHFHGDRDYFECHEILEEYWKNTDKNNKHSLWVGLILMAVSQYHHRRKNFKGAKRTLGKGLSILEDHEAKLEKLGLDAARLITDLKERLHLIHKGGNYTSYYLPIRDPLLQEICLKLCTEHGFSWSNGSNLMDEDLVHRHKTRDRSMVIKERLEALEKTKIRKRQE